jgi:hypothetical protein
MKLQVAVLFRGYFRLPVLASFRFWERTGAGLVQPTSLTSGNAPHFYEARGAGRVNDPQHACSHKVRAIALG